MRSKTSSTTAHIWIDSNLLITKRDYAFSLNDATVKKTVKITKNFGGFYCTLPEKKNTQIK